MTAINRDMVSIFIVAADVDGASVDPTADIIKGEITSHNLSGGTQDIESVAAFGGYIDKEKPREQFEISMDVVPKISATASETDRWDVFKYGAGGLSSGEGSSYAIFIQAKDGSNYKTTAINNARVTTWEPSHSADDNSEGSITFKFSPEDEVGSANLKTSALATSDAFFAW